MNASAVTVIGSRLAAMTNAGQGCTLTVTAHTLSPLCASSFLMEPFL
jgi:hypothetical protein